MWSKFESKLRIISNVGNSQRVTRQNRRSSLETKEARIARQEEVQARNDAHEQEEGLLYGAGIAD